MATDIPPVHALVARVMDGLGEPVSVMRADASPHTHALRPSEAAALAASELVVWTDRTLTPWLAREIGALAPRASSLELMRLEGTRRLPARRDATFGAHDDADHGHDPAVRADATHEHGDGMPIDAAHDPHGWLDPANGRLWLDAIAEALAALDPDNAARYAANAAVGAAEIDASRERVAARLEAVRDRPFVVFHDSIQYLEERFGLRAIGALSPHDASPAGPARLRTLRGTLRETEARCVFVEVQLDPRGARSLLDGLDVRVATLDPLGATLAPGPMLYARLLETLADEIGDCLGDGADAGR